MLSPPTLSFPFLLFNVREVFLKKKKKKKTFVRLAKRVQSQSLSILLFDANVLYGIVVATSIALFVVFQQLFSSFLLCYLFMYFIFIFFSPFPNNRFEML